MFGPLYSELDKMWTWLGFKLNYLNYFIFLSISIFFFDAAYHHIAIIAKRHFNHNFVIRLICLVNVKISRLGILIMIKLHMFMCFDCGSSRDSTRTMNLPTIKVCLHLIKASNPKLSILHYLISMFFILLDHNEHYHIIIPQLISWWWGSCGNLIIN